MGRRAGIVTAKHKRSAKQEPQIVEMPAQKMAVVRTEGDPSVVSAKALSALYGAVYKLKFDLKKQGIEFKVGPLRARWPNAHLVPKDQWIGLWALPIPNETTSLSQKVPGVEVQIDTWDYGNVAQILHVGSFSEEGPAVERLHSFIAENGYEFAGPHEEEYLTKPDAKTPKTIIRYEVKKK